jgi:large subunit ribosomal protein L4
MTVDVINLKGEKVGRTIELPDNVFSVEPNDHALYLSVKSYLAAQRQGTHSSRGRSEVAGSTRKLHKQKGTGGSRKGDIKNPLYRGGGRIFGPKPRTYSVELNKKVRALARKSALSYKASEGKLLVIEDFQMDSPKTKELLNVLKNLNLDNAKVLWLTGDLNKNLYLSSRNLKKSMVSEASNVSTYDLLNANTLVLSESSVAKLAEVLA